MSASVTGGLCRLFSFAFGSDILKGNAHRCSAAKGKPCVVFRKRSTHISQCAPGKAASKYHEVDRASDAISKSISCTQPVLGVSEALFYVLPSPTMRNSRACRSAFASPRGLVHGALWRLRSRNDADTSVDENSGAKRRDFIRNVPEHPLPRVLPPS